MNYRHVYHAGNFGDVLKHIVLVLCLHYLRQKDSPFCVIDSHAGAGHYDLGSPESGKTAEGQRGIGRLAAWPQADPDLRLYLDAVSGDMAALHYPGSPLLIARSLRPDDRLIAAELHPATFDSLSIALSPYRNARAVGMDGYECIRANLPPRERRGLVLIDPPYERNDEFEVLMKQMAQWKKRWPTGVYLLWYPIKANLPVDALKTAAGALGIPQTWCAEVLIYPRTYTHVLNGCGVLLFNAPFTVPERVTAILPTLKAALQLQETGTEWLQA